MTEKRADEVLIVDPNFRTLNVYCTVLFVFSDAKEYYGVISILISYIIMHDKCLSSALIFA